MKRYLIFASAVACLMVAGCAKDKEKDFADDQVSFSARTGALETRTDYGTDGTVGGQTVTYVNWVAGDKIKILSSTGSSDTYTITEDHDGSTSQGISKANVNPDGAGIAWGTGTQTFYGMYPANVAGSNLTESAMTCVIPGTWTPANDTELAQLPYGYMFARLETARTTNVSLTFNPKFTAFSFTLKNPTGSAVTLSSFSLSSASKAMSGTYTVNTSNGAIATLPTAGDNKSVTVNFSSLSGGGLVIPAGTPANPGTKTFTLVTVPDTFNDLTISCVSAGTTKTMGLKKNGNYLTFAQGKKHNLAITLPSFENFDYTLTVTSPTDLDYAAGTSSTGRITSKRSDGVAVSWSVENYYASAADAESKTNPLGAQTWVTSGLGSNLSGGENLALNIAHTAITPVETTISTDIAVTINAEISGRTAVGTESAPINLANASGGTGTYITESANCYIVNGPGWYKIPLVMGNGVKGNRTNTLTVSYTGASSPTTFKQFRDYKNQVITSPYLQASNSATGTNAAGTPTSATVWQPDESNLVTGCAVMGATSTTADSKTVYWLKFHVSEDYIQQGSAVINVSDGSKTMWSYHIWVCDYDSSKSITKDGSTYMPYPLGWKATGGSIIKKSFKVYARIEQVSPGTEHGILELECPETYDQNSSTTGDAPYYQWGRKDPLRAGTDNFQIFTENVAGFTNNYYKSIADYPNKALRPYSIGGGANTFWSGGSTTQSAINLWNAANSSANYSLGQAVSKTIYDPCPAGYMVPSEIKSPLNICSPDKYLNPNAASPALGGDQSIIYFWTCVPNSNSNSTNAYYYRGGLSSSEYTLNAFYNIQMYAMRVLPVVDSSYDPRDDGNEGAKGLDINWVN